MDTTYISPFLEYPVIRFFVLLAIAWAIYYICKIYIVKIIQISTKGISSTWSGLFLNTQLLSLLSSVLPIIIIYSGSQYIDEQHPNISAGIDRICLVLLVVVAIKAITITLNKFSDIYNTFDTAKNRPIKGVIQIINIVVYIGATVLIFSAIFNKSPWVFLSGFGAMTAVLLLVFRDTILSFVAGIQLTTNNLIQMGDWIEMPQFNADGDVIDIALHTVKVQNWDKTITVIPTHKFLENSFKNWRGMQESGGRRIKRSLFFDMSTVRFLDKEEITKLSKFLLLSDYINQKTAELEKFNESLGPDVVVNTRRMTNIGTFRIYLVNYLKQHSQINQNMSLMVRQLEPGSAGLPLEIYAFVSDVRWVIYEQVQSDIFDHIIAIAGEFGLRIHQNPTGFDFRLMSSSQALRE